jgi:hypothetical protein
MHNSPRIRLISADQDADKPCQNDNELLLSSTGQRSRNKFIIAVSSEAFRLCSPAQAKACTPNLDFAFSLHPSGLRGESVG